MIESAKLSLAELAAFLEARRGRIVIDADVHLSDEVALPAGIRQGLAASPHYFHGKPLSIEQLLAEMDLSEVDMALAWQNPAATHYPGDRAGNYAALLQANAYIRDCAHRYPTRIIPGGWTDPRALGLEGALQMVDVCVHDFGFPVIKLNPAQNGFPIDSPETLAVVDRVLANGAIPAFHYGADTPFTPPAGLAAVVDHCGDWPLLAVHMGGGGASYLAAEESYQQSRQLGLLRPNLHFILSAKRDTHIESDLIAYQEAGAPMCWNLSAASDAPYGRVAWNFGGFRAVLRTLRDRRHPDPRISSGRVVFDEVSQQRYLGGNLARLLAEHIQQRMLVKPAIEDQ